MAKGMDVPFVGSEAQPLYCLCFVVLDGYHKLDQTPGSCEDGSSDS